VGDAWKRWTLLALLAATPVRAEESPRDIARKSRDRGALNLVGLTAELKLLTIGGDGTAREQVLTTSARTIDGRPHVLARFSAPAGVAGVAVLTVQGDQGQTDEVSLYLPRLRRVRRVARADRGKAFMDTDFAYADLAANGTRDEVLTRLADARVDGRDCFVLEGRGDDSSPYGLVRTFVDRQTYVPLQVDYGDKADRPLKRYRTLKLKAFQQRVVAADSVMENLQTGSKTTLSVLRLEEATLGDEAFTERALERG
jgi:hypothetical protein